MGRAGARRSTMVSLLLPLDVGSENGVDAGLVSFALSLEPFHDIAIQPDRHGSLRLWKDDFRMAEPGCVRNRRCVRIGGDGLPNHGIVERRQISLTLRSLNWSRSSGNTLLARNPS